MTNIGFLPWPLTQPCISVPFFDLNSYRQVNLDSNPSCLFSGGDLPFHDIYTLRFFYNLGVQHSRNVLARQQLNDETNMTNISILMQEQYSRQLRDIAAQQLTAQQQHDLLISNLLNPPNLPPSLSSTAKLPTTTDHYTTSNDIYRPITTQSFIHHSLSPTQANSHVDIDRSTSSSDTSTIHDTPLMLLLQTETCHLPVIRDDEQRERVDKDRLIDDNQLSSIAKSSSNGGNKHSDMMLPHTITTTSDNNCCIIDNNETTATRPHPFHLLTAAENLVLCTGVDPKVCHLNDRVQSTNEREPELLAAAARAAAAMVETRTANGESALLPNMISYLNAFIQSTKRQLKHCGILLTIDGNPLNFSARPIDPIFKAARKRLQQQEMKEEEEEKTNEQSQIIQQQPQHRQHRHYHYRKHRNNTTHSTIRHVSPTTTIASQTTTTNDTTTVSNNKFVDFERLISATIRQTLLHDSDEQQQSESTEHDNAKRLRLSINNDNVIDTIQSSSSSQNTNS